MRDEGAIGMVILFRKMNAGADWDKVYYDVNNQQPDRKTSKPSLIRVGVIWYNYHYLRKEYQFEGATIDNGLNVADLEKIVKFMKKLNAVAKAINRK